MSDGKKLLDSILAGREPTAPKPGNAKPPKNEVAGYKIDPVTGEGYVSALTTDDRDVSWDDEMVRWGLDPEIFEVVGIMEVRAWDVPGHGTQRYTKGRVQLRTGQVRIDDVELTKWIRKRATHRPVKVADVGRTDFVAIADLQIGKAFERGGGTPETIRAFMDRIDMLKDRVREHKLARIHSNRLVVAGLGDIIERCNGHYSNQQFTTDLNEREQRRVARNLLAAFAAAIFPLYNEVWTAAVGSNHGQNRGPTGRLLTTHDDDADLELWETWGETCAANEGAFGHVTFFKSPDPLIASFDVDGTHLSWTHSHQIKGSASKPVYRIWDWWGKMRAADVPGVYDIPVGRAHILVTGHYHHHFALRQCGRTLLSTPAMDGGSEWLTEQSGLWSRRGMLTFQMEAGSPDPRKVDVL